MLQLSVSRRSLKKFVRSLKAATLMPKRRTRKLDGLSRRIVLRKQRSRAALATALFAVGPMVI